MELTGPKSFEDQELQTIFHLPCTYRSRASDPSFSFSCTSAPKYRFEHQEENKKDCLRTLYALNEDASKANKLVEEARASYVKERLKANPEFMNRFTWENHGNAGFSFCSHVRFCLAALWNAGLSFRICLSFRWALFTFWKKSYWL